MAADWIEILSDIEAAYPLAVGTSNSGTGDEVLRSRLVGYAWLVFQEISAMRRWGWSYASQGFPLVANDFSVNAMVEKGGPFKTVSRAYITDAAGFPQTLEPYPGRTLEPIYGVAGGAAAPGRPGYLWIVGDGTIRLYPKADQSYTLQLEGETALPAIVETTGTVAAAPTTTVTVPAGAYLTANGIASSGATGVSLRNAGNLKAAGVNDSFLASGWSAVAATTVTLTDQVPTNVSAQQMFFNSTNWFLKTFPKALLFGVLREVAAYSKSADYKMWEARYQNELELACDYDNDRLTELEKLGVGLAGQRQNAMRSIDTFPGYEVRGGVL